MTAIATSDPFNPFMVETANDPAAATTENPVVAAARAFAEAEANAARVKIEFATVERALLDAETARAAALKAMTNLIPTTPPPATSKTLPTAGTKLRAIYDALSSTALGLDTIAARANAKKGDVSANLSHLKNAGLAMSPSPGLWRKI